MANKTEAEILEELDTLEEALRGLLQRKGAIYYIDLQFFRDSAEDLKQELRIARAKTE